MKKHLLMMAFAAASFLATPVINAVNAAPVNHPTFDVKKVTALTTPVTGTVENGGTFAGTFTVTKFVTRKGQLFAQGTLSGTLTDAAGNLIGTVTGVPTTFLVTNMSGTCQILDLELGPLDLELLGLVVHLDRIDLEITAQQGPGNLLGNLLCAVANLLNPGNNSPLSTLAGLLNQILGLL